MADGSPATNIRSPTLATPLTYITRLDHLQLPFLWDDRPHIAIWYDRLRERRSYRDAFDGWPNESYYALMKEKGLEAPIMSKRY